jgi:hypothetical protein
MYLVHASDTDTVPIELMQSYDVFLDHHVVLYIP